MSVAATRVSRHLRRAVAAGLVVGASLGLAAPSMAAAKSPRELIPADVRVLFWSETGVSASGSTTTQYFVSNAEVVGRVRALINALPLSPPRRVCPDDLMIPVTVAFATSASAAPTTRVVFQLGGCPSAEVFQGGHAVLPTLGGSTLTSTFDTVRHLVVTYATTR